MLDLGTRVNIFPYSVFIKLRLGELYLTLVVLLLVDRFIKIHRGIVEDVLVYINKFYFFVDFIIIDT